MIKPDCAAGVITRHRKLKFRVKIAQLKRKGKGKEFEGLNPDFAVVIVTRRRKLQRNVKLERFVAKS